eukprot:447241-Amphidinium_carterae.1
MLKLCPQPSSKVEKSSSNVEASKPEAIKSWSGRPDLSCRAHPSPRARWGRYPFVADSSIQSGHRH